jgi:hypothetical protein
MAIANSDQKTGRSCFQEGQGKTLQPRQIGQPKEVVDIAWKAQV